MKELLRNILQSQPLYARFLNTLSLLEYIGARKILKSQKQETLNDTILNHVTEELRHARILKRAALKLEPELCATYMPEALLCGAEACAYFQKIDHAAGVEFGEYDPWYCYLYTTLLIETRATSFYTLCTEILQESGKPSVFRGILVEEQRHLEDIENWLQSIPNAHVKTQQLQAIETQEFEHLLQAFAAAIG